MDVPPSGQLYPDCPFECVTPRDMALDVRACSGEEPTLIAVETGRCDDGVSVDAGRCVDERPAEKPGRAVVEELGRGNDVPEVDGVVRKLPAEEDATGADVATN